MYMRIRTLYHYRMCQPPHTIKVNTSYISTTKFHTCLCMGIYSCVLGARSEMTRENLKSTRKLERSWQLLGYAGFLRAGVHKRMHDSSVKYDWFTTRSLRSSFGADTSKIFILKGGRLCFTMAKSPW